MFSLLRTSVSSWQYGPRSVRCLVPMSVRGLVPRSVSGLVPRSVRGLVPRSVHCLVPRSVRGLVPRSVRCLVPRSVCGLFPMVWFPGQSVVWLHVEYVHVCVKAYTLYSWGGGGLKEH